MLLGVGAVATKTYVDDIFSTYVYEGDGTTSHQIVNGLDLATHGGLIWGKERGNSGSHYQFDTVRGLDKRLKSNSTSPQETDTFYSSVNSNGYTINKTTSVNVDGNDYVSWSFRQAPGSFTVKKFTGNGTNQTLTHDLGCVPGCIMYKNLDATAHWVVWHRGVSDSSDKGLALDQTWSEDDDVYFNDTDPTATHFTVGAKTQTNGDGDEIIAYLFAGGESDAATARSLDFDGSGDYLSIPDSSDFNIDGTNFTLECWFKADDLSGNQAIAGQWELAGGTDRNFDFYLVGSTLYFENCRGSTNYSVTTTVAANQWYHIAGVLDGTTLKLFVNGNLVGTTTVSGSANNSTANFGIGGYATGTADEFNGKISNLRFVKGTAVYTSSFRPPTEPLTNITNTKLLCCNNSSTTGSTVTPGTITANGDPTASTDSPFDDPAGFVFGDAGDQNVIKCGSYVGNGSSTGPEIFLGWEPQLIILKESSNSGNNWSIWDSMRGITTGGSDALLEPNDNSSEWNGANYLAVTPTGFKLESDSNNGDGRTMVYMAIRRPDGYVGKPPELGTDVFAMDTGNSSSNGPAFDSNFAVDFTFSKEPSSTGYWITTARLINKWLRLNDTDAEASLSSYERYDLSKGVHQQYSSSNQAFMFKRHAGFDVVTYKGNGVDRYISHSMNQSPEMMWFKKRNSSKNWYVYHSGLDGGNSPEDYSLRLNTTALEDEDGNTLWNQTVPTATHFRINTDSGVNADGDDYLALLFSSVSGISKVGRYTGNGSDTGPIITTGFAPRFLIIRRAGPTEGDNWNVYDTIRGFSSGSDPLLKINNTNAQLTGYDIVDPTSDGFQLVTTDSAHNSSNVNYVYYAHA